jgi:hypothetical protein
MRRFPFFVLPLCLLLLLLVPSLAAASPTTFDQALDHLYANGYPQAIDQHLFTMPGTNPQLGFSWAGTWADNAKASYVAGLMRAMGLKNVHFDRVPVDVFDFKSASVAVGGKTMVASSFAGIPPTPRKGLTGQVVWAHEGTAQEFDKLAAAGVSVKGKLVLVDADPTYFWMNCPAGEATLRGAKGVIFTFGPTTAPYWTFAPDVLGSFDGTYNMSFVPAVYISQQDGASLESQLDSKGVGPVATMKLVEKVRMATQGGAGYNVIGDLPGRVHDSSFVLWASHHDAHFHAATDDSSCLASEMAVAKAMVMSHYRPLHTVRFMITTAEEFGYTNAYNDWCIGAWWAITRAHPDWAGKIRAFFNEDYFSGSVPLSLVSPDFAPLLEGDAAANAALLPNGCTVGTVMSTWQDGWTFMAAGVPTVSIGSVPPNTDNGTYHTQYMVPSQVDWPWVADISKFLFREADKFNGDNLLPYGLKRQADDLAAGVVPADLLTAGAKPANVTRLSKDVVAYQAASAAYEARAGSIPQSHYWWVNRSLRHIEKTAGLALTGITPFQTTVFRHSQALLDVQCLNAAIGALQASPADTATALGALAGVDFTYYGMMLSHPVYLQVLAPLNPHYDRVAWGGQANPVWPLLDVMPQYNAIQAGTWDGKTVAQLTSMRNHDLKDLNSRLNAMSAALEQITPQINALH